MKKVCNSCKIEKPVSEFHKRGDKWQPYCKACKKKKDVRYNDNRIIRNKEYLSEYLEWYRSLKNGPCTDCGQKFHFAAMHWDHLPEYEKKINLSRASSKKQVLDEISKCELVCANCHFIRTHNRRG